MVHDSLVPRRIFGSKSEVTGNWRKLHNEGLHTLYSSPNIIRIMHSTRMRWVGHVAYMGLMRTAYIIVLERLKRRYHLEDLGMDGRTILKLILGK
jgi:hypothetical protein